MSTDERVAQGFTKAVPSNVVVVCSSFHPVHISLADNLLAFLDEHRIDLPAISDIEETVPALDDEPQVLALFLHCGRQPPTPRSQVARELTAVQIQSLLRLLPTKVCSSSKSVTSGISSGSGASSS